MSKKSIKLWVQVDMKVYKAFYDSLSEFNYMSRGSKANTSTRESFSIERLPSGFTWNHSTKSTRHEEAVSSAFSKWWVITERLLLVFFWVWKERLALIACCQHQNFLGILLKILGKAILRYLYLSNYWINLCKSLHNLLQSLWTPK